MHQVTIKDRTTPHSADFKTAPKTQQGKPADNSHFGVKKSNSESVPTISDDITVSINYPKMGTFYLKG